MPPKLVLKAAPTFTAKVGIPVAGGATVEVQMTFKHRTKTQFDEFVTSRPKFDDVDTFMDMVCGWDLADAFSRDAANELLENYIGAAVATYLVYVTELTRAKLGN